MSPMRRNYKSHFLGAKDNIDIAFIFHDVANRNYHLRHDSPFLNDGLNLAPSIPDADIDGETRIMDATVDIGAGEVVGAPTEEQLKAWRER